MAVMLETSIQVWNGASSDAMPSSAPEGSRFHIVDTGAVYLYHNGMWQEDLRQIYAIKKAAE